MKRVAVNPVAQIVRKRDGGRLSADEIAALIEAFVRGEVPDYQMSALAMAILFRGMDSAETSALVEAMLDSGGRLQWPSGFGPLVDKHSTGGIGDKASLVLAPLLACCGLKVPMLSGRGLGATGGTLDKLESIRGFRTDLSAEEIRDVVERIGCVITGTTADLVPADRKLYALRDVTGTVPSIPLICASIMSKKLAENVHALVLDVKFGSGAFLKHQHEACQLAQLMVDTGSRMGVRTVALVTDMNQPHGRMAGNAVEVEESIATLRGEGPADLIELCIALAVELLIATGAEKTRDAAERRLAGVLQSGDAFDKFCEMVQAQGGDLTAPRPIAPASIVSAAHPGFVAAIDGEALGMALIELGGGRKMLGDQIDHSVGLEMLVRIGDRVEAGQPLVRIFASDDKPASARTMISQAILVSHEPHPRPPLIAKRIEPLGDSP